MHVARIDFDGHSIAARDCRPTCTVASAGVAPVLLVHGIASDSSTWLPVQAALAQRGIRSVAMDLLGHGASDKPRDGYTLDRFSASIGAVRAHFELDEVILVGHSFGGALAMYHAHHHRAAVTGLGLVSSGGLGLSVHPMLRVLAMPGGATVLRALVNARTSQVYSHPWLHRAMRLRPEVLVNLSRTKRNIGPKDGQAAFMSTLRHIITPSGQLGSMMDVGYLDRDLPTLIVWSVGDPVVPVSHAHDLHAYLSASRLELFAGTSHEPHRRFSDRFAELVDELGQPRSDNLGEM